MIKYENFRLEKYEAEQASREEGECLIPLFHGTRKYALEVGEEERKSFFAACDTVMRFAKKLGYSNIIPEDKSREYRRKSNRYFLDSLVYSYGDSHFQYGDFYLTSSYTTAISFARNAGGELGEQAYSQCVGFKDFGIDLAPEAEEASRIITEGYEKYKKSDKMILVFTGVRFSDLCYENGCSFHIPSNDEGVPVYSSSEIRNLYKYAKDSDRFVHTRNFRLKSTDNYPALALYEKDFRWGLGLFTAIKDPDDFMKKYE